MTRPRTSRRSAAQATRLRARRAGQRGAATLIVVMVLFFIVAMVAAYTARNLIFEQRTSANQYRSTQAFEAAEAGLEWALTMLNSGRIDALCAPHDDPSTSDDTFRQRYLSIATATGAVSARTRSTGEPLRPACVFDGGDWRCSCPADDAPTLSEPSGAGPFPAFVLRFFSEPTYPPGVVRIESTGCTRLDAASVCDTAVGAGDSIARTTVLAALRSALVTAPVAALTARRDLNLGSDTLVAANRDPASGGFTLHVGRALSGTPLALHGPAGTPGAQTVIDEPDTGPMAVLTPERMFASVFAMPKDTYRLQPATITLDCSVDCSAATVRDTARLNPGRMLWIAGDLVLDIDEPIGSAAAPVLLVVTGNVAVPTASGAEINGLVYVMGDTLVNGNALTLRGALVAETDLVHAGGGATTVDRNSTLLGLLRTTHGSFVRVPGSWRDF
jgi:type II secretory pathway pseudopilin PulG